LRQHFLLPFFYVLIVIEKKFINIINDVLDHDVLPLMPFQYTLQ
jgi:hypothetical protein